MQWPEGKCTGLWVLTPGFRQGWVTVAFSSKTNFTLTVPLSTQECKWVLTYCQESLMKCWSVTLHWTSIPFWAGGGGGGGGVVILLVASCLGNWDKFRDTWLNCWLYLWEIRRLFRHLRDFCINWEGLHHFSSTFYNNISNFFFVTKSKEMPVT